MAKALLPILLLHDRARVLKSVKVEQDNSQASAGRTHLSPLRILLISHTYPPVLGGSEIEAQRVCAALIRRGHEVNVLCSAEDPMPRQAHWIDPYGVPVRIIGLGWPAWLRGYIFATRVAWILLRERHNYQLVYFLMQGLHLATGLAITRLLRKPVVMKISGSSLITMMRQSWLGRLELDWLQRWAKRVMILNQGMAEEALGAGFLREQLLWMPNPTDVDEFCPAAEPERLRLREERKLHGITAVFVGRLAPEKELGSLIGAFARAAQACPNAELVLVGDGPCRAELAEKARALKIEAQVRFTGRLAAGQVHEWLQASDVFALVSSQEGFPCSLAEAMSAGLPSVVSDIPGNRQLIEPGVNGFLAPVKDESALAGCLQRLFEDDSLRARMGVEARRRIVDNYSTDRVAQRYEILFREVLGQQSRNVA